MQQFLVSWWPLLLAVVASGVFWAAVKKCQHHQFYSDTPYLFWLGIFVWGDALVLAPFWLVSALLFLIIPNEIILRFILIFFIIRATYEVIYWINHQVAQKEYVPPLFRRFKWIKAQDAAILYQLLNMCQVILGITLLLLTFE
jgi:hypothetical protein